MSVNPTLAETKAIRALRRLAKTWPKSLWLYSAGELHVMRADTDGGHQMLPDGGVDPDYIIASVSIPNSGGDW